MRSMESSTGPSHDGSPSRSSKRLLHIYPRSSQTMEELADASIHLIVTSPPYPMIAMWDAQFSLQDAAIGKALEEGKGNEAFERMHLLLDRVWKECYRVLCPGGFLCINIGDATRTVGSEFQLYSNHSRITEACRAMGFTVLPLILWRKATNAPNKFMGAGMFPAGAYVTLEHEYILIFRKGDKREFRTPEEKARRWESAFFWEERNRWFVDLWDLSGVRQELGQSAGWGRGAKTRETSRAQEASKAPIESEAIQTPEASRIPLEEGSLGGARVPDASKTSVEPASLAVPAKPVAIQTPEEPKAEVAQKVKRAPQSMDEDQHFMKAQAAQKALRASGNRVSALRSRSAAFPLELAYRLIMMYSLRSDWVLDPFVGTGTTLVAAAISGRNGVGYEVEAGLIEEARKRILACQPLSTEILEERLQAHRQFMYQREWKQGKGRQKKESGGNQSSYWNETLQVPVVTRQETRIVWEVVNEIREIQSPSSSGTLKRGYVFDVQMERFTSKGSESPF